MASRTEIALGHSADAAGQRNARLVDRLMDPTSLERWVLESLTEIEASPSRATVLRITFRVGANRIAELAMDEGYRQMAEQTTEGDAADDRAIVVSRRARAATGDDR